jgi:hypothetical protein
LVPKPWSNRSISGHHVVTRSTTLV